MEEYTIYCTEEQIVKALELGAPIIVTSNHSDVANKEYYEVYHYESRTTTAIVLPTAEQMIGWLEEHGFWYINTTYYVVGDYWCYHGVTNGGHDSIGRNISHYNSRKEATLAAIDAALDYLIKMKE